MPLMDMLLLATGFTGAWTLWFVVRALQRRFGDPPTVQTCFSPGNCTETITSVLRRARKEILVLARSFASPALAQALVEAKTRGVHVEIVFDPRGATEATSDFPLFTEQGLAPLVLQKDQNPVQQHLLLVDHRTIITGSFPLSQHTEEKEASQVVVISGYPDLFSACRQHYQEQRARTQTPAQEPVAGVRPSKAKERAVPEPSTADSTATESKTRARNGAKNEVSLSPEPAPLVK